MLDKQYANIVVLNDYEDDMVAKYFKRDISDDDMIAYMKKWDHGEAVFDYDDLPCGSHDVVIHDGYYYLYSNLICGYVGLAERDVTVEAISHD